MSWEMHVQNRFLSQSDSWLAFERGSDACIVVVAELCVQIHGLARAIAQSIPFSTCLAGQAKPPRFHDISRLRGAGHGL